ncbi:bacteriophage antitermination protein Q, partial [Rouxiella chamberiensis]|uniref:bacteriophage antitermination protein Q n=1 Tax=Rouxiella chamberiensis TaxID=1513468 RepID=UPI0005D3BA8E
VDAELVTYREGKKYKQNKPLILEGTFRTAIWRQAVNKLPELHQSWVKYCYGDDLNYGHQLIICQAVWERFTKSASENGLKKMSAKTLQKVRALV